MNMARARTHSSGSNSQSSDHSSIEWQVGGKDLLHSMGSYDEYDYDDLEKAEENRDKQAPEYAKILYGYKIGVGGNNGSSSSGGGSGSSSGSSNSRGDARKAHGFHGQGHLDHSKSVWLHSAVVTSLCLTIGWFLYNILPKPAEDLLAK